MPGKYANFRKYKGKVGKGVKSQRKRVNRTNTLEKGSQKRGEDGMSAAKLGRKERESWPRGQKQEKTEKDVHRMAKKRGSNSQKKKENTKVKAVKQQGEGGETVEWFRLREKRG